MKREIAIDKGKSKGVIQFHIRELLCVGEFSKKDLLEIYQYIKNKNKYETISHKE